MNQISKNIGKVFELYKNSQLIRVSAKNSVQVIIKLITGLLSIKFTSIFLGTAGMTLLSQFNNIIQFSTNIASGGVMHGVTKLSAHFDYSRTRQKIIVHSAFIISAICTIIPSLIIFLNADTIALTFFYDIKFSPILKASGILIFSMALNNLLLSFINGIQEYNKYIFLNIISGIISAAFILPAIYLYGLLGAIWAQYLSSVITTTITIIYIKKHLPSFRRLTFSKAISKRLITFGLMLLVASSTTPLVKILSRNIIIEYCSLNEAGWWDGIGKISNTYTSLIISTISLYILPKISKTTGIDLLNKEIKISLKQIIPLVLCGSLFIYLSRDYIISILFTKDFSGMKNLFLYQCLGDVFKIISWFFAITIMMKEQVKQYIFLEIIMAFIIITNMYIIIPKMGITGSTLIYAINMFIYFIFVLIIYIRMLKKSSLQ